MKKLCIILVAALLIGALAGCGANAPTSDAALAQETKAAFDLEAYKANVAACRDHIMENSIPISNLGNYEINYVKTLGSVKSDVIESAYEWLAKKSDYTRDGVEALDKTINEEYKAVILTEIEGKEAAEIDTAIRSMYENYHDLYSDVHSPAGTPSSFANSINHSTNGIIDANDTLSLFIGESESK